MPETIESFVAKLQAEGVQAGRQEAQKLREEAEKQAERILAEANEQAEKIVADAKAQGEAIVNRAQSELSLAARDVVLRLRETLGKVIEAVLAAGAKEKLRDVDFIGKLLHELIIAHAKSRMDGTDAIKINVSQEQHEKLVDWALREVGQKKIDELDISLDLKGTLTEAGFEYTVCGATVDVTLPSVVETLSDLVSPSLRELVENAIAADRQQSEQ